MLTSLVVRPCASKRMYIYLLLLLERSLPSLSGGFNDCFSLDSLCVHYGIHMVYREASCSNEPPGVDEVLFQGQ